MGDSKYIVHYFASAAYIWGFNPDIVQYQMVLHLFSIVTHG